MTVTAVNKIGGVESVMSNFFFVLNIITVVIGMFCLGAFFILHLNNRNEAVNIIFVFFSFFSLLNILFILGNYVQISATNLTINIISSIQLFNVFILLFILVYLVNRILIVPKSKFIEGIFIFTMILVYVLCLFDKLFKFAEIVDELYYVLCFIYFFFVFMRYKKNIINSNLLKISKITMLITVLFAPGIIIDDLIKVNGTNAIVAPIFYCAVSILAVISFYKFNNVIQVNKTIIPANLIEQYGITKREEEVINLLAKGYSYSKISDELIISISTVRTHITNIYRKLSINSRYELLNLL